MASKRTYELELLLGARTSANYTNSINSAKRSLTSISNTAKRAATVITAAFAAVNVTAKIEDAVETYAGFEQAVANTSAIANASAAQYEQLSNAAKLAGRDTVYTAQESADALGYMALAGWDVNASTQALMPILRLASATGADLKTTSDLVTDSMSALGIGVNELDSYLDLLAETNNDANTTAEQLMEAMVKAGGSSRTLGADILDTTTALGILANNGLKGAEAGTALNAIFVRLAGNSTALKELDKLDVHLWDDQGKFIGFKEGLIEIKDAMSQLTDEEKSLSLKNVAGTNYYSQMSYLLEAVEESADGAGSAWDNLEEKAEDSAGALDKMYDKTTDTLEFAQKRWESAKDASKINFADTFSDGYKDTLNWMSDKLPEVTDAVTEFAEAHEKDIAKAFDKAQEVMGNAWEAVESGGAWLIKNKGAVISALKGVAGALIVGSAANKGASIISFIKELENPVAFAAGIGISAVVGGIVAVTSAIKEAKEAAVQANLEDHFGSISLSLEQLDYMARQIVGEESLRGVSTLLDALADTENTLESVTESWDKIQKESWQLNAGFTFDKDHSENYEATIENYITSVEQFAKDKGYEVHLAANLLFGQDSEESSEASEFFKGIEGELEGIGSELSTYLTNAMTDGILDMDEDAIVQEYLQKMNSISQKLAQAQSQAKIDVIENRYDGTDLDPESFIALQEDVSGYVQEITEGAESAFESAMTEYRYKQMTDTGYTDEMFDTDWTKAKLAELELESGAMLDGLSYINSAITSQYKDEMTAYGSDINAMIQETFSAIEYGEPAAKAMSSLVDGLTNDTNISTESRGALAELYEQLKPNAEKLEEIAEQYRQAGAAVPQSVLDGINEVAQIGALSGDYDAAWKIVAGSVANSEEYQSVIQQMADNGYLFDEVFAEEIKNNQTLINDSISQLHTSIDNYVDDTFASGFDTSADVRVTFNPSVAGIFPGKDGKTGIDWTSIWSKIPRNAEGGIYDKPLLTTFAEEGPEAAIPLDGSKRAKGLLMEAADRLGMLGTGKVQTMADSFSGENATNYSESRSTTIPIYYSPQITITGNASQDDVSKALSINMDELRAMIEKINEEKARVSFAH